MYSLPAEFKYHRVQYMILNKYCIRKNKESTLLKIIVSIYAHVYYDDTNTYNHYTLRSFFSLRLPTVHLTTNETGFETNVNEIPAKVCLIFSYYIDGMDTGYIEVLHDDLVIYSVGTQSDYWQKARMRVLPSIIPANERRVNVDVSNGLGTCVPGFNSVIRTRICLYSVYCKIKRCRILYSVYITYSRGK